MKLKTIFCFLAASCILCSCSDDATDNTTGSSEITLSEPAGISFTQAGGSAEVTVTASGKWRLIGDAEWCEASVTEGQSGETVVFTAEPNGSEEKRETVYKFFTGNQTVELPIVQGPQMEEFELTNGDVFTVVAAGGTVVIYFSYKGDYEVEFAEECDWAEVQSTRASITDGRILVQVAPNNKDYFRREATLNFTADGKVYPVVIKQNALPKVELVGEKKYEFGIEAQVLEVVVKTNLDLELTLPDWITLRETKNEGVDGPCDINRYIFDLAAAPGRRSENITIKGSGASAIKITVSQVDPNPTYVDMPDAVLRSYLTTYSYCYAAATDAQPNRMEIGGKAKTCTSLEINYLEIESLEGLECFVALETLKIANTKIRRADFSEFKSLKSLDINKNAVDELILGDIDITTLAINLLDYGSILTEHFTISSTKLRTLNMSYLVEWDQYYDLINTIDVSACPALDTFKCRRGTLLTKLIFKQGQVIPNLDYDTEQVTIEYK